VHTDLKLLKQMMTWATMVTRTAGRCSIATRWPATWSEEPNPNRPVLDGETVEKLLAVADRSVADAAAHEVDGLDGQAARQVRNLRWDDFDFDKKTIRWRAEHDKKRKTWVVPMPKEAERVLLEFRAKHRVIGSALVFPMRNDPNKPVSRHLAADWLKRAYRYAKLERPKGGLWHPFRRKFATERKFYPLRDVADAGGWKTWARCSSATSFRTRKRSGW